MDAGMLDANACGSVRAKRSVPDPAFEGAVIEAAAELVVRPQSGEYVLPQIFARAQAEADRLVDAHIERLLAERGRLAKLQRLQADERARATRLATLREKVERGAIGLEATHQKIERLQGEIDGQAHLPGMESFDSAHDPEHAEGPPQ
ncbi:MAG TPA: hypothetical protein VM492_13540 [Sumerlaeia bacterium]|nr:hypothetical protein [Sumerlaeia bacterium]